MGGVIRANYEQLLLLPPCVEDWIALDHPARFIRDFVDAQDLAALGFVVPEGREGRPAYGADLLLKVWLYGYFQKIRSTRGLERGCYDSMALVWLTGNHAPDHNTLWRFWRANRGALRGMFKRSVEVAVKSEMVSWALQAVDGTKVAAEASTATAWHRKRLEKVLARLDEAVDEVLGQTEAGEGQEETSHRMPEAMSDAGRRRAKIVEALAQLKAADRERMHPKEPEAVVMACSEGKRLGYNAQAVTEEKNHVIVAAEVTREANDMGQLNAMIAAAAANTGAAAQASVADGGYFTGKEIAQAQQEGRAVVANVPEAYAGNGARFHRANFTYDSERDEFVCPMGERLAYWRDKASKDPSQAKTRVYRCGNAQTCPCRGECTKQARGRTINKDEYYEAVQRQIARQKTPEAVEALRRRKEIAELPFAWIKRAMGFRRWTVRGLENVRTQWALVCATVNLRTLFGAWRKGTLQMT